MFAGVGCSGGVAPSYAGGSRMMEADLTRKASCHCRAVRLELRLPDGIDSPRRCNCSMCRMRGAIVVSVALDELTITEGADKLSMYQFNTMTARHYFCSICGIYTHHQRRSNPRQFAINVACLEGIDVFDLGDVPTIDGIHHPCDR